MEAKFSPRVKDVITYSREEALRLGHDYIGTEHLLLGIIREGEGTAVRLLKSLNVDLQELRKTVEQSIGTGNHKVSNLANIPLMKQAERALKITYLEAKLFKSAVIGTEHLILSILKDEDNVATKSLHKFKIDYDVMKRELELSKSDPRAEFPGTPPDDDADDDTFSASSTKKPVDSKSKTPVLDNFGRD